MSVRTVSVLCRVSVDLCGNTKGFLEKGIVRSLSSIQYLVQNYKRQKKDLKKQKNKTNKNNKTPNVKETNHSIRFNVLEEFVSCRKKTTTHLIIKDCPP